MYAVIETGGKQFKVSPGDVIRVEKLDGKPGERVDIPDVLMIRDDDGVEVGRPRLAGTVVRCSVVRTDKHRKIIVFKKKPRKQFKRTRGHRQLFTELKVLEIARNT